MSTLTSQHFYHKHHRAFTTGTIHSLKSECPRTLHFLIKPLTRVIHLLTNEDFRLISSAEVTEERLEDVMEDREDSKGSVKSLLPLTSSLDDGWPSSSSVPHSSAIGLLSQGILLNLRRESLGSVP